MKLIASSARGQRMGQQARLLRRTGRNQPAGILEILAGLLRVPYAGGRKRLQAKCSRVAFARVAIDAASAAGALAREYRLHALDEIAEVETGLGGRGARAKQGDRRQDAGRHIVTISGVRG